MLTRRQDTKLIPDERYARYHVIATFIAAVYQLIDEQLRDQLSDIANYKQGGAEVDFLSISLSTSCQTPFEP
ncbi:unnamed protein product [Soboliphyme baturini]|uniref:Transposase n=1 Tax=Soboliphyme baturini TaxID=241478 RepID=A0A183IB41_9BILA|nr:unnamed protein product [Soboliphyme baturini]